MSTAAFTLLIVAVAVGWFALLWVAICYLFARASGWNRLRRLYETGRFEASVSTVSGRLGRSRLRGALVAGATPAGLYLNVSTPFRIFAAPVLIPWPDITVSSPSSDHIPLVSFDFVKAQTSLRVREDVATMLLGRAAR